MAEADGSIIINVNLDDVQANAALNKLKEKIRDLEKELEERSGDQSAAKSKLDAARDAAENTKAKIRELKEEISSIDAISAPTADSVPTDEWMAAQARRLEATQELEKQRELLKQQDSEATKLHQEYARITDAVNSVTQKLDDAREKAGGLVREMLNVGSEGGGGMREVSNAAKEAEERFKKLTKRITGLVKRVAFFALITKALQSFRQYVKDAIYVNEEARQSIAKLKGSLQTLAQPILSVAVPAFTVLINVITRVISAISRLVSMISGVSVSAYAKSAENLEAERKALNGVGGAANKAKKSLASFDEINQIGNKDDSGGGSGSSDIAADYSGPISDSLTAIVELFTGALLLGLGAILTFSGANIPLGLGLMALGAIALWDSATENWGAISSAMQGPLGIISGIVGGALLVIGAILAFSGANVPLGIGLMIAGAAVLAPAVAANWDSIKNELETPVAVLTTFLSIAFIAIGSVLLFSGANIPIGLGLLVAGFAAAAAIAPKWEVIKQTLQGPVGLVTGLVGSALLAIGAVLLFSGASIPLGLGMLAAGGLTLAATLKANWQTVENALKGPIGVVTGIVGGALLVLGVILLFSGVGIPLGLGMIAAGGISLAAALAPNWDWIVGKIKGVWDSIKQFWNDHIAQVFTGEFWANLGKNILNGLIGAIESGINFILKGVSELVNGLTSILNLIPGVNIGEVNWATVKLPRLAQGAVIPPNREFMAVLGDQKSGTNIETPLSTMVQAFRQALAEGGYGGSSEAVLMLDREQLGKVVWKLNKAEGNRIGLNLAGV